MGDQAGEGLVRQRYPELLAWLSARESEFDRWAAGQGPPGRWDFGAESLDDLEEVVRERFPREEDLLGAKDDAFVQGATWYVGEAVRRSFEACGTHDPLVWMYDPAPPAGHPRSGFFDPATRVVTDTPFVGAPDSVDGEWVYPLGVLNELYSTVDEWGEPVEPRLRGALHDPYDDEDDEDDEGDEGDEEV
ncbi:hypothetical protein B046DRAFT_02897 [Streptomyces sp. LamerLS-316]|uniref:hypothetical protein n=1 Tax=unclassified Streptomyces TaxID=2593676 RepID=UPI000823B6A3|nr:MULTISPECIES: hypothetical protein [unclassified Streptomyces]MYQ43075.1 hypothetical protein [Streptomyces sp. SID4921]SCK34586.1 hypothetical protein B046DRAFT_02897 [Streptomyces sp. LamerLS-316]